MGRYDAANTETASQLSWTPAELRKLALQREELKEIPIIPASYAVTRNIMTAFRETVNSHRNPRASARSIRGESRRSRHQTRPLKASQPHAESAESAEWVFKEHESHESGEFFSLA